MAGQLVLDAYRVTARFPRSETFGLTGLMRRAAASISMNLPEGAARAGAKEFARFVNVAVAEPNTSRASAISLCHLRRRSCARV